MKHDKLILVAAFVCALAFAGSLSSVHAEQITNILASADSTATLYFPIYAVNGAGLSGNAHTSNPTKAMWLLGEIDEAYFIIDLKKNYSIETLNVWNYNQAGEADRGIKKVKFFYSTESLTFTEETNVTTDAAGTNTFDMADGLSTYSNYNTITFNTSPTARYIKITVEGGSGTGNYDDPSYVGLSEVQAFGTFVSDPTNSLGDQITVSNVTASSSASATYGPTNLIDGSGLTNLAHDTAPANNMWFSTNGGIQAYIDFDLGVSKKLGAVRIWNFNYTDYCNRGIRTADILVSDTNSFTTGVITNHNNIELLIAPGITEYGYDGPQIIDMKGVSGRYVRISTVGNSNPSWGDTYVGLSEVQFFLFVPPPPPSGTMFSVR